MDPTTVFVFNIPEFADEDILTERFKQFGPITRVKIVRSGGAMRNAYVRFKSDFSARHATAARVKMKGHHDALRVEAAWKGSMAKARALKSSASASSGGVVKPRSSDPKRSTSLDGDCE